MRHREHVAYQARRREEIVKTTPDGVHCDAVSPRWSVEHWRSPMLALEDDAQITGQVESLDTKPVTWAAAIPGQSRYASGRVTLEDARTICPQCPENEGDGRGLGDPVSERPRDAGRLPRAAIDLSVGVYRRFSRHSTRAALVSQVKSNTELQNVNTWAANPT